MSFCLSATICQSIGHILAILFGDYSMIAFFLLFQFLLLYSGVYSNNSNLSEFVLQLSKLNVIKETFIHIFTYIYGFGQCPEGQTSAMMLRQGWTVDIYDWSLYILIIQCLCYRFIAYICLKIKMNYQ